MFVAYVSCVTKVYHSTQQQLFMVLIRLKGNCKNLDFLLLIDFVVIVNVFFDLLLKENKHNFLLFLD